MTDTRKLTRLERIAWLALDLRLDPEGAEFYTHFMAGKDNVTKGEVLAALEDMRCLRDQ